MGAHGWTPTNYCAGLAASAFTFNPSYTASDRSNLNDGLIGELVAVGNWTGSGPSTFTNYIQIDFGSAKSLYGIALLNSNIAVLAADAQVRVRAADDSGFTSGVVTPKASTTLARLNDGDRGNARNRDHVFQFVGSDSKRYWRIEFAFTGTVSNAAFGEVFAYPTPYNLSRKGIYGSGDKETVFKSTLQVGENGERRQVFFGGPLREKVLRWQDFTATERDELRLMFWVANRNAGKLLWINSISQVSTAAAETEQDCIYGHLVEPEEFPYPENDFNLYQPPDFHILSMGREVGA
jgi:hypothetical protein